MRLLRGGTGSGAAQRGFTYMMVLVLVAAMGAGLAVVGTAWSTRAQREREEELLFVGQQFRAAIESYAKASAGAPEFPRTLEDLVEDRRAPTPRRHLRRIYRDPLTGTPDWGLVLQGDRIVGVHSRSAAKPFKTAGFAGGDEAFASAATLAEWRFVYRASSPTPGGAVAAVPVDGAGLPSGPTPPPVDVVPMPEPNPGPPPQNRPGDAACDDQRAADLARCAGLQQSGASPAQIGQCNSSATARYFACTRRQPIPVLRLP